MNHSRQAIHVKEIRELARRYTAEEIEACIAQQLGAGTNPCEAGESTTEIVNVLAKAEYVQHLMQEKGMTIGEAIRELGRRIRAVQQGDDLQSLE
jgi:uncharacterized protein YoaH (UPF0181 family)